MSRTRPQTTHATLHFEHEVMGTVVTFDLYRAAGLSREDLETRLVRSVATLDEADTVFSTWKPDSALSRLRHGTISLGEAPPDVAEVLAECKDTKHLSGGWFDPWAVPGGVDPTGYVKGWATQRALGHLVDAGLDGAMINAAGDIASFGGPGRDTSFRVGIVNPASPLQLACAVELRGALATSGTYERGSHLVNPFTGVHETRVASASVTGPDLGVADALATALCVGGDEVLAIIEHLAHYEAFIIGHDGHRQWTSDFAFAPL
ncbi:MAG TPA: FAD:protein FMN transferase [Acidimicrobiales bacterium]|nr:FAD:protein FMN transferase [Acidimicrobiales bacterium]